MNEVRRGAIVGDADRRNSFTRLERDARRLDDVSRRHPRSVTVAALVSAGVHGLAHPFGHRTSAFAADDAGSATTIGGP